MILLLELRLSISVLCIRRWSQTSAPKTSYGSSVLQRSLYLPFH